jgi:CheY-like chemotaxis protein
MTAELPKRILVVEDDEDSAELLSETLRLRGYSVAIAHSGADALEVAVAFEPSVVFLDLGLPDMDGTELCPRLRALPRPPQRLIALTGFGGDHVRLLGLGFHQCLLKPASTEALACAVEGRPWPS